MIKKIVYIFFGFLLSGCVSSLKEQYISFFRLDRNIVHRNKNENKIDSVIYRNGKINSIVKYQGYKLKESLKYDDFGVLRQKINIHDEIFSTISYYNKKGHLDSTIDYLHNQPYGNYYTFFSDNRIMSYKLNDISNYKSEQITPLKNIDKEQIIPIEAELYGFSPFIFSINRKTDEVLFYNWILSSGKSSLDYYPYIEVPNIYLDMYISIYNKVNTYVKLEVSINDSIYKFEKPNVHTIRIKDAFATKGAYDVSIECVQYVLENGEESSVGRYNFQGKIYRE